MENKKKDEGVGVKELVWARKYTPLYKKGIKKTENKPMETNTHPPKKSSADVNRDKCSYFCGQ